MRRPLIELGAPGAHTAGGVVVSGAAAHGLPVLALVDVVDVGVPGIVPVAAQAGQAAVPERAGPRQHEPGRVDRVPVQRGAERADGERVPRCRWLEIARDMSPSSLVYGSGGIAWPFMRLPRPSSGVPSSSRSPDGSRIATPTTKVTWLAGSGWRFECTICTSKRCCVPPNGTVEQSLISTFSHWPM